MWWHYLLVIAGAFLFDVVPFPFPPAFTIMLFLQVKFHLNMWLVVVLGVIGSIAGRYILTLYIPHLSHKFFRSAKNEDIQFLGEKMKKKGIKAQLFVLLYSLLPLPTTPLFIAAGIAKIKPYYVILPFFVGKFTSDAISVAAGKYAVQNTGDILKGAVSVKSMLGLAAGLLLVFFLFFIDWRRLLQDKKFTLKFNIFKH